MITLTDKNSKHPDGKVLVKTTSEDHTRHMKHLVDNITSIEIVL